MFSKRPGADLRTLAGFVDRDRDQLARLEQDEAGKRFRTSALGGALAGSHPIARGNGMSRSKAAADRPRSQSDSMPAGSSIADITRV